MDYIEYFNSVKCKKITVVGFGVSNRPFVEMLANSGASVTVRDKKSTQALNIGNLDGKVKFITGEKYLENLDGEIIFKTPGMRRDLPQFIEAEKNGAKISSEMELFFELCPCRKIAVTGSEGKTTTTTLIYNFLTEQGYNVFLGGNIGTPLLPRISQMTKDSIVVAELSSFQLFDMKTSAETAVITNIVEEHLNWHTSMDEYIDAKKNVFRFNKNCNVILNADYETTASLEKDVCGSVSFFSRKKTVVKGTYLDGNGFIVHSDEKGSVSVMHRDNIKIVGDHNVENYCAAITATWGLCDLSVYRKIANEFGGVEHRMEFVRELDGVKYYNDSIATSPTSVIACLKSQKQKIITISGGSDKNLNYADVAPYILMHVKHMILTGQTAQKIYKAVIECDGYSPDTLKIEFADGMEDAVNKAHSAAVSGDIVYLSPISASFDCYSNFEERGKHYKQLVNSLK